MRVYVKWMVVLAVALGLVSIGLPTWADDNAAAPAAKCCAKTADKSAAKDVKTCPKCGKPCSKCTCCKAGKKGAKKAKKGDKKCDKDAAKASKNVTVGGSVEVSGAVKK